LAVKIIDKNEKKNKNCCHSKKLVILSQLGHTKMQLPTVLVQSMIRSLPNSLWPMGRMHGRTHGCKWSLLKVREGNAKGSMVGAQVESGGLEHVLLFSRFL
jgi:uncharacterized protein (DUF849 family)